MQRKEKVRGNIFNNICTLDVFIRLFIAFNNK